MALGHPAEHMALSRTLARTMGLSLTEAMQSGQLSPQGFAALVTRCRACTAHDACRAWSAGQDRLAQTAPAFCPNARVLDTLTGR